MESKNTLVQEALKEGKIILTTDMLDQKQIDSFETNLECIICFNILRPADGDFGSTECLECEVGICRSCVKSLEEK